LHITKRAFYLPQKTEVIQMSIGAGPMTAIKQDRQSARRTIRILWILQGHVMNGLRLKQIADALHTSQPNALRDLEVMREEGVTERIPGREDCWRLTPKLIQTAVATSNEFARLRERMTEFEQRYSREPK
jgi:DNA-binding IclR family transcriptional regulator